MPDPQALRKEAANERYRDKYRSTKSSRKHRRKKARHERVLRRELVWLKASGIPRDERWPLA